MSVQWMEDQYRNKEQWYTWSLKIVQTNSINLISKIQKIAIKSESPTVVFLISTFASNFLYD